MSPAGGDERPGEGGGPRMHRGVSPIATAGAAAGQDLGAESGSRKRKAIVMPRDSGSLVGNGEHLEVACEESQRVLKEIEDLRAQLDDDVKELGYCEANQKLRVELALKAKEIQCLRKHNEEMQAKYDGMRKPGEDLQDKNDSLVKWNEVLQTSKRVVNWEPQAKNGGLTMQNEELKAKNDCLMLQNVELQAKNDGLAKHNEELQAKNVGLVKQNAELQTIRDGTRKRNRDLQAKNDGLIKRSEELQAKNDGLRKRNDMLQLQDKNDGLTKPIEELEAKNDGRRKQIQSTSSDLKDGLTGCTDIGTQISRDIILESVQCLKQAEPIQRQAASNLDEIGCLQAQVTKLETAVNRLLDNNRTLAESKAALKEEVAAYAADLERCRKKNEALESEKASTEELLAYLVEDSDADLDDTELNTRICDLMCTSRKSKSHSKKRKDRERDSKTNK